MKKKRVQEPQKVEKDILKDLIAIGLGGFPFAKLPELARIFVPDAELVITIKDKNGKILSTLRG